MSDEKNVLGEDLDMTELPKLLEVYLEEGPSTVVSVYPWEFFTAVYPEGMTNGDPAAWGVIMCDTIRHIARSHHQAMLCMLENTGRQTEGLPSEEVMLERIMTVLVDEMKNPKVPGIKGETIMVPKDQDKQH